MYEHGRRYLTSTELKASLVVKDRIFSYVHVDVSELSYLNYVSSNQRGHLKKNSVGSWHLFSKNNIPARREKVFDTK